MGFELTRFPGGDKSIDPCLLCPLCRKVLQDPVQLDCVHRIFAESSESNTAEGAAPTTAASASTATAKGSKKKAGKETVTTETVQTSKQKKVTKNKKPYFPRSLSSITKDQRKRLHVFCRSCIVDHFADSGGITCPLDQENLSKRTSDRPLIATPPALIFRCLNDLVVSCDFHPNCSTQVKMSSLSDHLESSHANVVTIKKNLSNTIPSVEEQDDRYSQFITNHHHDQQSAMMMHQQQQEMLFHQQYMMNEEEGEEEPRSRHSKKDKSSKSRSKKHFEEKLAKLEKKSFERMEAMRVHLEGRWSQVTHEQLLRLESEHQRSLEVLQKNHSSQMASLEKKLRSEIKTSSSSVKRPAPSTSSQASKRIKTRHHDKEDVEDDNQDVDVDSVVERVKKIEETLTKDFKNLESKVMSLLSHPFLSNTLPETSSQSKKGVKKKESLLDMETQVQKCLLLLQTTQKEVDILQKHVSSHRADDPSKEIQAEKKPSIKKKDSSVVASTSTRKEEVEKKTPEVITPASKQQFKKQPITTGKKMQAKTVEIPGRSSGRKPPIQEKKRSLVEAAASSVKKTAQKRLQTIPAKAVLRRSCRTASTTTPPSKKDTKQVTDDSGVVKKKQQPEAVGKAIRSESSKAKTEKSQETTPDKKVSPADPVKKMAKKKASEVTENVVVDVTQTTAKNSKKAVATKKVGKQVAKKLTPNTEKPSQSVESDTVVPEEHSTSKSTEIKDQGVKKGTLVKKGRNAKQAKKTPVAKKSSRLSAPLLEKTETPVKAVAEQVLPTAVETKVTTEETDDLPSKDVVVKDSKQEGEESKTVDDVDKTIVTENQVSKNESAVESENVSENQVNESSPETKSVVSKESTKEDTTLSQEPQKQMTLSSSPLKEMSFEVKEPKSSIAFSLLSSIVASSKPSSSVNTTTIPSSSSDSIVDVQSTTTTNVVTKDQQQPTEDKETQSSLSSNARKGGERSPASSDSSSSDILRAAMDLSGVEEDLQVSSCPLPSVASIATNRSSSFFTPFSLPFMSIPSSPMTVSYRAVSAQVAASTEVDTPTSATAPPPGTKVKVTKKKRTTTASAIPVRIPVVKTSSLPKQQEDKKKPVVVTPTTAVNGTSSSSTNTTAVTIQQQPPVIPVSSSSVATTVESSGVASPEVSSLPFRKRRTAATESVTSASSSNQVLDPDLKAVQDILNDINSRIEKQNQQEDQSLLTPPVAADKITTSSLPDKTSSA